MSNKKKLCILALVLILALTISLTVIAANEPVNNAAENETINRGPGINCEICEGEPQLIQRQTEERRQLRRGENGEQNQFQRRKQLMQNN